MKKHTIVSGILIAMLLLAPLATHAAKFVNTTVSFGGKVLTGSLPGAVTCIGFGTGPVILYSNVLSLGSAIYSGVNSKQTAGSRVGGVINGLYGAIPYYAKSSITSGFGFAFISAPPKAGDWILGKADIIPETNSCYIPYLSIPFPVKDTGVYRVSNTSQSSVDHF